MYKPLSAALIACTLLSACDNDDNDNGSSQLDQELRAITTELNLDGDPSDQSQILPIPQPGEDKVELGKKLFFSKHLSGEEDTACVSCHHPLLGGGDDLSLSIGVQAINPDLLGPGRLHDESKAMAAGMEYDGGPTVPRNAPTTFNFSLYQQSIFHDGRIEKLADDSVRTPDSAFGETDANADNLVAGQARFPVTSPEEMASSVFDEHSRDELRQALAERLQTHSKWQQAFDAVYGEGTTISYDLIADAIAHYEASQLFIDSPWNAYMKGDNAAISEEAKEGAKLFFTNAENGGAGCVACHSGDFFSDEAFHNIALPQIGRGKGNGDNANDDFGRFRETGETSDKYAFRTPTLLNITATGPYGHAGSYDSLEAVVRHHLNPAAALDSYDFTLSELAQAEIQHEDAQANSQAALDALQAQQQQGQSLLNTVELSDEQVQAIIAFLETLTDPCVEDTQCLTPWIADEDQDLLIFTAQFQ